MTSSWTHPGWSGEKRSGQNSETKMAFGQVYYVCFCLMLCPKHQKIHGFALALFRQGGVIIRQWGGNYQARPPPFTPKPSPTKEAIAVDRLPMFGVYNGLGKEYVFSDHFRVLNVKLNRLSRARST